MTRIDAATARALLCDLVETPSVSGNEGACAERLVAFFEEHGRSARIDEVGNVRAPADDAVLLTSHLDTVPGEIPVRVEDGVLWGRGSVDATGPLVALAVAAVETGTSFAGVVREETDSAGARHLVADREPPGAVINGEPSGWDAITLGYRGILSGTYRVATESRHTSLPEPNAIQQAMRWWDAVESTVESPEETPLFEQVTAKPVEMAGGTAGDGLSVEAALDCQLRIPPGTTATELQATVGKLVETGEIDWGEPIPPVMESPRNPVARGLRQGIRDQQGEPTHLRKSGTSDMNVYAAAWDVPMATYGPGDSALDHAPDERLDLATFDRAISVLRVAAEALVAE